MTKAVTDSTYDPQIDGLPISDVMTSRRYPDPVTVTIPLDGATYVLSTAVDIGAAKYMGIIMPATWTAAVLTFKVSSTLAGTYTDLYDETGAEVSISVAQGKAYTFNIATWKLAPWRFIKFRSGTTGAPVDQTAVRTLTVVLKP